MSHYGDRVKQICNGCAHKGGICGIVLMRVGIDNLEVCPCRNCLIKVMCHRICSERAQFYGKISSDQTDDFNNLLTGASKIRRVT